jgi:hypothetical protein
MALSSRTNDDSNNDSTSALSALQHFVHVGIKTLEAAQALLDCAWPNQLRSRAAHWRMSLQTIDERREQDAKLATMMDEMELVRAFYRLSTPLAPFVD